MVKGSTAKLLLLIVNVLLLLCGALMLYFTVKLTNSGWLDAFKGTEYNSFANNVITVFKVLAGITMALAFIGLVGAVKRQKCLLVVYAICMFIIMVAFGIFAVGSFSLKSKLQDWQDNKFPAEDGEQGVGEQFNQVYCYAQGAYLCNTATAKEALAIFIPGVPEQVTGLLPDVKGINSLCNQTSTLPGMDKVCAACGKAQQFQQYNKVFDWAQEKCRSTSSNLAWCGQFLATGKPGEVFVNSPYKDCRGPFLEIATNWSGNLAWVCLATAIFALVLLVLAFAARRHDRSSDYESK